METVLRLEQVSKSYGRGRAALEEVSFQLQAGEFVAVIGSSGAGKSTLLRSINQLQPVSSGDIWLGGESVVQARGKKLRQLRRRIGMVFQNYNLVYRLSVLQNVLHGRLGYMGTLAGMFGRYSEADKERAIRLLQELQLGEFLYHRAGELSGGQKQRVGIARAFMQDLELLLCDEPIASLDPSSARIIMDMLQRMVQERGITCLVNLHQIEVARQYATRVIGLRQGKVVFDGPPAALTEDWVERIYGVASDACLVKGDGADVWCAAAGSN